VGVAGHGLGFNAPNTVQAGHTTAIHIRIQNFSSTVTETQIGYIVTATCSGTCTGTVTLSAACTGTVGPLIPGATQVASGCTATFSPDATGTWTFTLIVIHCGADGSPPCTTNDGGIDANNSNNVAVLTITVT
jgi:hypothetical protein